MTDKTLSAKTTGIKRKRGTESTLVENVVISNTMHGYKYGL